MPTLSERLHPWSPFRGQSLIVLSAVAFSSSGFFTRKAPVDVWAMILWRNLFGSIAIFFVLSAMSRNNVKKSMRFRGQSCAIIGFGALGTICYLAAFKYTSVANISIIYATAPLIAAFAARAWLGEITSRKTLVSSIIAVLGVGVTVGNSLEAGSLWGDGLALLMTVSLSFMAVAARGSTLPVLVTSLVSALVAALAVLPIGWIDGASFIISWPDAAWLAGFGVVTMAIALPSYLAGAADVPASTGMLISALELPLAPFWVWLAFGESTTIATLIGGGIVALAILHELTPVFRPSRREAFDTDVDSTSASLLLKRKNNQSSVGSAMRQAGLESNATHVSSSEDHGL